MKRYLLGITATLLFVAAGLCLTAFRGELDRYEQQHPEKVSKETAEADTPELDDEYNSFYEVGVFETDLPVIYITSDQFIEKDIPINCRVSLLNAANDGTVHRVDEKADISFDASIRIRGASSSHFEKSQYRIKLLKDTESGAERKYDFFGMGSESEWVLNGPFLDKTLARNYIAYNLAAEHMEWAPESRYVELFVNGQYRGVYLVTEPVSNGTGRLRLSKFGLLNGETAYIVSRDRDASDTDPLQNYGTVNKRTYYSLYVEYPGKANITDSEYAWIENDISEFEEVLFSDNFADPEKGYAKYIDVDNFVDYFIINEVFMIHDADVLSTYVYKELGGKMKLTVWDFNNGLDNYQWFAEDYEEFFLASGSWFRWLIRDRAFVDRIVARYRDLRKTTYDTAHIFQILDSTTELLGDAVERNFKIWGYTFNMNLLVGSKRNPRSYEKALEQFRETLTTRIEFLDEHITDLYDYCK